MSSGRAFRVAPVDPPPLPTMDDYVFTFHFHRLARQERSSPAWLLWGREHRHLEGTGEYQHPNWEEAPEEYPDVIALPVLDEDADGNPLYEGDMKRNATMYWHKDASSKPEYEARAAADAARCRAGVAPHQQHTVTQYKVEPVEIAAVPALVGDSRPPGVSWKFTIEMEQGEELRTLGSFAASAADFLVVQAHNRDTGAMSKLFLTDVNSHYSAHYGMTPHARELMGGPSRNERFPGNWHPLRRARRAPGADIAALSARNSFCELLSSKPSSCKNNVTQDIAVSSVEYTAGSGGSASACTIDLSAQSFESMSEGSELYSSVVLDHCYLPLDGLAQQVLPHVPVTPLGSSVVSPWSLGTGHFRSAQEASLLCVVHENTSSGRDSGLLTLVGAGGRWR